MIIILCIVDEFCMNMETSLWKGHLSTFVDLELTFEASIVNLSVFDSGELQHESLSAQLRIVYLV